MKQLFAAKADSFSDLLEKIKTTRDDVAIVSDAHNRAVDHLQQVKQFMRENIQEVNPDFIII